MIKELTLKEVARKLADEGCFEGLVRDYNQERIKRKIVGIYFGSGDYPIITENENYVHCDIEIPDTEPVYEPYPDDVCPPLKCGDVIVSKNNNTSFLVVATSKLSPYHIRTWEWKKNEDLFDNYTYQDGSPIGRVKE